MTTDYAAQMQRARDLRMQLQGLEQSEQSNILFQEFSPGRRLEKLWSMIDGTEIEIPRYMVFGALCKVDRQGRPLFTGNQEEAPPYVKGSVKCFLAAGSSERESGLLDAAGLSHLPPCAAESLRSAYSKRVHAQNRHQQSWAILQEFVADRDVAEQRLMQQQQLDATLALARTASTAPSLSEGPHPEVEVFHCGEPGCTRFFDSDEARTAHMRRH